MTLWRLHIRTSPGNGKTHDDVVNACMEKNVAGIGWPVSETPKSVEDYVDLARREFEYSPASIAFATKPQIYDLLWARDLYGVYYLGQIEGHWHYSDKPEDLELDIPHQIPCRWVKVGNEEHVPGKIIACFRRGKAFQAILDDKMEDFSKWLFNQKSNGIHYKIDEDFSSDISADDFFKLISADDCEDIVALYLQVCEGYCLIPSTCKRDTAGYEFILKHRETKTTAAVQVKQGCVDLDDTLSASADTVYLFSTYGQVAVEKENMVILNKEDLYRFVLSNKSLLPSKILYWFEL